MSSEGSVTNWIDRLQAGDAAAVQPLWERYFHRLVGLARKKLQDTPRRVADEEDVALSAFDSFCRGAEHGRFPRLEDRDNLWPLLVVITVRKAYDLRRRKHPTGLPDDVDFEQLISREPDPAVAAQLVEEYQRLLDALGNDELRSIAQWKMEGETETEIAARLGIKPRTVRRKLRRIRTLWKESAP